jgi:hypothetical protein
MKYLEVVNDVHTLGTLLAPHRVVFAILEVECYTIFGKLV